jgi:hypothetical protein
MKIVGLEEGLLEVERGVTCRWRLFTSGYSVVSQKTSVAMDTAVRISDLANFNFTYSDFIFYVFV